ncbi:MULTISPECIES: FecR family protein [unclassified Carboxylicivirga]|uniref:FecR family protein n=1 Tax=Carboxylicivirga TaxID=1628153 RepID=UPI003D330E03
MKELKNIQDKLKRKQSLTDEDYSLLSALLDNANSEMAVRDLLQQHWAQLCNDASLTMQQPDELFYKIHYEAMRSDRPKIRRYRKTFLWVQRVAAILLLPVLFLSLWYFTAQQSATEQPSLVLNIESPGDAKTRFFLPDGSVGWLQANSTLQYQLDEEQQRLVSLQGEAYFDVAKNAEQPFVVQTDNFKVRVLGTRFNVVSQPDASFSKVYLEEGRVEMLDANNYPQVILQPGDEYLFDKAHGAYSVSKGLEEEHLAWTQGKLLLKNKPLKEAARALEKFYGVDIIILDKELETMPVYAKIHDETLEEVLNLTELILPIDYRIEKAMPQKDGSFTKTKVYIRKINH